MGAPGLPTQPCIGASHPGAVPRSAGLNASPSPFLRTSLNAPITISIALFFQGPMEITRLSEESGSLQKKDPGPLPTPGSRPS